MKVLVFAHTPPPHHGQSYMVGLLLKGFADGRHGIEAFHVNAHFAREIRDIGKFRLGKFFLLWKYIGEAIWIRFRHGVKTFYYVPAPGLKNAMARDWVILLFCRLFFSRLILHWQAAGLAGWLDGQAGWVRWLTHRALDGADVSIALSQFSKEETEVFRPRTAVIAPNGIPDPCPDFAGLLARRRARLKGRKVARVLYMALALREKGVFDAINGVLQANQISTETKFHLSIAGKFFEPAQEEEFNRIAKASDAIAHLGFVAGEEKRKLLEESDIFCFPTYYEAENSPVGLIEAMAFGLPVVTTRWHSLEAFLPKDYPGVVDINSPGQIAAALLALARRDDFELMRNRFLEGYTIQRHLEGVARALKIAG